MQDLQIMKVLITTNYVYSRSEKIKNWLALNAGQWVDIDTKHLFKNQYNTKDGLRIYDTNIDSVKGDARAGKTVCRYCGQMLDAGDVCTKNTECASYGMEAFNDKNTFFLKHPNGKDPIKKVDFEDSLTKERFFGCYSVNGGYYRISRRSSIEFILVGDQIYISNSIGYTPLKKAHLSNNEITIVQYCADKIKSL